MLSPSCYESDTVAVWLTIAMSTHTEVYALDNAKVIHKHFVNAQ